MPRNILVIKHGALGDIIQGFDAYASLRAAHKGDHLAVLTTPPFAGFFSMMPYFDEVLTDNRAGIFNLRQYFRIRKILRRDWVCVYDLQTSQRTRFYCEHVLRDGVEQVSHAKRAGRFRLSDMRHMNNRDRMLAIIAKGGCAAVEADLSWMTQGATKTKARNKKPVAVLVPGCSPAKPQKRWPPAHFAALAKMLTDNGHEVVMVGTAADRDAADGVLAGCGDVVDLIGKTDLGGLAQILAGAEMVIGNDTGPVFLAARIGTPTLMLMSAHTDAAASAPVGAAAGWLQEDSIADITPEAAHAAITENKIKAAR